MAYKVDNRDIINPDNVKKLICPFVDCKVKLAAEMKDEDLQRVKYIALENHLLRHVFEQHISHLLKRKHKVPDEAELKYNGIVNVRYYFRQTSSSYWSRTYKYNLREWEKELYKLAGKRKLKNFLIANALYYPQ